MKYLDYLATPEPLEFGQVITDPMANNGEPFIYQNGADGVGVFPIGEGLRYDMVDLFSNQILPGHVYRLDRSFSYGRAAFEESFPDYYRRVREAERFLAFISWHVRRMGEAWLLRMPDDYDTRPEFLAIPPIRTMSVYDARVIRDGIYELNWAPEVRHKFVDVERSEKLPAVV